MASNPASYAKGLRYLKHFLENECAWRLLVRGEMYREYFAVSSISSYFNPEMKCKPSGYICCQLMLFRRPDCHVFCLTVNGKQFGQYKCGIIKKTRYSLPGLKNYYVFHSNGVLEKHDLGFIPNLKVPDSVIGGLKITPTFLYEHCSLVPEEESESIVVHDHVVESGAVRLGGICAWAVRRDGELFIYVFVLTFDLFAACCDREKFPSLSRMYAESVQCEDVKCFFCNDHKKHVDPFGEFIGCVPDTGNCFCYAPCTTPSAKISQVDHLPFFTEQSENATTMEIRKSSFSVIGSSPDRHICIRDKDGNELSFKSNSWNLVKLDHVLSRLLILSCPVLKKLVIEAM